jgi:hypothetical protein
MTIPVFDRDRVSSQTKRKNQPKSTTQDTPKGYSGPLPGTPVQSLSGNQRGFIDGIPVGNIQQGSRPGFYMIVDPQDPDRSGKDLLLLAEGRSNTPRFVPVLEWENSLYKLSPDNYKLFKNSFNIKDQSVTANLEFVDRFALPSAAAVSYDNFNRAKLGQPSISWEVAILEQGYGRSSEQRGPTTTRTTSVTGVDTAIAEFQNYAREYLGYELSAKEAREYQKKLNALEKKRFTTTTAGEGFTNILQGAVGREEREQLALDIIGRRISIEGIDDPGKVGGLIGNAVRSIRSLAGDFGLSVTPEEVRDYALQSLRSQTGLDTISSKFNNLARIQYQGLAPYLDQGLTVRDISNSYISKKAQLLELNPAEITINDSDIQRALTGQSLKPLYEFEMDLRKNPQWEYTNNAREEASSYAYTILRDFGLI